MYLISKKIVENLDFFQQFDIKYKLHLGEYNRWNKYTHLIELEKKDNVEIIKDVDLYALFSLCEYQVDVYSTALSEGIKFGCKIILLNLPEIEEMDKFKEVYGSEYEI